MALGPSASAGQPHQFFWLATIFIFLAARLSRPSPPSPRDGCHVVTEPPEAFHNRLRLPGQHGCWLSELTKITLPLASQWRNAAVNHAVTRPAQAAMLGRSRRFTGRGWRQPRRTSEKSAEYSLVNAKSIYFAVLHSEHAIIPQEFRQHLTEARYGLTFS